MASLSTCLSRGATRLASTPSYQHSTANSAAARPDISSFSRCSFLKSNFVSRSRLSRSAATAHVPRHQRRCVSVRASDSDSTSQGSPENAEKQPKAAPLTPESPSGVLLEQLLQSHPHLVPAAAEQQLEQLAAEKDAAATDASGEAKAKKSSSDLVLYKRMAEVRDSERTRAIKEVMYALIVQKFIESGAPLLPSVPFVSVDPASALFPSAATSPFGLDLVPTAPVKDKELARVHSEEALDMVKEHLATILGPRPAAGVVNDDRVVVGTSKLRLGQVYAASIMYGYFLRRVDQRFQLEKSIGMLKGLMGAGSATGSGEEEGVVGIPKEELVEEEGVSGGGVEAEKDGEGAESDGTRMERTLRAYVQSFDADTLQRTATMRSRESVEVIERHTEALFGKPEVVANAEGVAVVKDDSARLTVSTLRRLILEAVAFGSFLWDVESFVDSRYKITSQ